jgi:hypothetical protein
MYLRSSFYVAVIHDTDITLQQRRNLILNTYTDITTTATQKLDLKYIYRYNYMYYGNVET